MAKSFDQTGLETAYQQSWVTRPWETHQVFSQQVLEVRPPVSTQDKQKRIPHTQLSSQEDFKGKLCSLPIYNAGLDNNLRPASQSAIWGHPEQHRQPLLWRVSLVTQRIVHLARAEFREEKKGRGEGAQRRSRRRSLPSGRLPAAELGSIGWRGHIKTPGLSEQRAPTHSRPLPLPTRTHSHG